MNNNFLTKEGFNKLQKELDFLRKERRQEVAARLREASDGEDLIENAEYEAAKNDQERVLAFIPVFQEDESFCVADFRCWFSFFSLFARF